MGPSLSSAASLDCRGGGENPASRALSRTTSLRPPSCGASGQMKAEGGGQLKRQRTGEWGHVEQQQQQEEEEVKDPVASQRARRRELLAAAADRRKREAEAATAAP